MLEKISTRAAYGNALKEFGGNPDIVALDADLASCTMSCTFRDQYPKRHFNVGIAEANMIDIAAGFATTGKIAFCHSFAMFTAGRGYDQIRNSVAYPGLNVKVIGSHAGLTVGEDGATHQCIEDLSLMRTIPGMTVIAPCDANETREAVKAIIEYHGPVYMRTGRTAVDNITPQYPNYHFEIGKGITLRDGSDVTLIACGLMVQMALEAADLLAQKRVSARVIDMHTIKPIDEELIVKAAAETGAIVTAEEHNVIGGLGSAVAEVLTATRCVPLARVGVQDCFGRSGEACALLTRYGLTAENIAENALKTIARKSI
ncbi:MAG: transketolase family protein [Eubacteriales bacterium]|nr:transketolase family protein [Eubacteriales bacterium]